MQRIVPPKQPSTSPRRCARTSGQWEGIASFEDVASFFAQLPNPDKEFVVIPGIAHTSTRSKNWALVYHLLDAYFSQPAPVYVG